MQGGLFSAKLTQHPVCHNMRQTG